MPGVLGEGVYPCLLAGRVVASGEELSLLDVGQCTRIVERRDSSTLFCGNKM